MVQKKEVFAHGEDFGYTVPGEQGRVAALDFPPAMLRRLRELGFLPGSTVTALHRAPFGGSTAYGVLDTVVALRDGDARRIALQ